jgi:hypothetical protein
MAVVKEEHKYGKNSAETYTDLEKAIAMMGTITKTDPDALIIEGKIKYGIGAQTKVTAEVQQGENESVISFESRGGDVFGNAARNNVERLLETMGRDQDPDYDVNKTDKRQWVSLVLLGLAVLMAFLGFFAISAGQVSFTVFSFVFGAFLLLGGILLRKRKPA